ncbi:ribonuclease III [bacterium]|nr:ribonuclease III [bacterium]
MEKDFSIVEKKIDTVFKNKDLLKQAFVHKSYINENRDFPLGHNERLEFLGDAVLELVVTEHLYRNFPNPEGELTNWRSALVKGESLSEESNRLEFNDFLYLSHGESKGSERARNIILANAFEAVIGAIYEDQGYNAAKKFIDKNITVKLEKILENSLHVDPKSKFQETAQEKLGATPRYEVLEEDGPDHNKHFVVGVYVNGNKYGQGEGSSKQQAAINAADNAIKKGF